MESGHHELGTINHARFMNAGYMDPQTTGQMRPPYSELCRPQCTDASTLAAYHSRYLPSMPLSTGSSFPFLGGMYTGSLPGPPTSPFRNPSTPGNNMRQFWPPTPPPDGGYGRLALNTNLFPLFGTSPDNGAFLTQGLVSRLGSTTHLPLIDHKEHSFFSHGIGLGTPLTPNSHVASPSPFPHLIPSLERHPVYGGHMTLGNKELEDLQHEAEEGRLMKSHLDCLMKHDIPSSRPKSKHDGKNCCDKTVDDCCKLSQSCMPSDNGKSHDEVQNITSKKQLTHKVQPCKIEVSHSPTIKHDLLSPPIDSPKSDVPSPNRNFKKTSHSPFGTELAPVPVTETSQTRCSQCCANVGVATKLGAGEMKENSALVTVAQPASNVAIPLNSQAPSALIPASDPVSSASNNVSKSTAGGKLSCENESSNSPVIAVKSISDKQTFCKSNANEEGDDEDEDNNNCNNNINNNTESTLCKLNNLSGTAKHVTAAVIPTAPKQMIHRDVHSETNSSKSVHESLKNGNNTSDSSVFVKEQKNCCTEHCVKVEFDSSNEKASPTSNMLNSISNSSFSNNRPLNKNLATSCKVKDMIKNVCSAKQVHQNSLLKNSENFEATKTPPESPSPKTVSSSATSLTVSPTLMSRSPNKNIAKMQYMPMENVRKCSPYKEDVPVMKSESTSSRLDCEFSQKNNSKWTKATVSPFTWQGNNASNTSNSQDDQAINLTVSKKTVKPEPSETTAVSELSDTSENVVSSSSNVIGICHPNPITMNKAKTSSAVSSVNNFASISVLNQPAAEQSTEVHILHRSSKSSFPVINRNGTSPVPLKSTISHVTANTSIHRSLKTERLLPKRGKISEMDKLNHSGRTTLATLAPKLSKNVNFGKDMQSSHTISASSSVSSTSIVFPATVNSCIPVGIAIAQQRQDSSTSIGKSQQSVPSSTPTALSTTSHLSTNHVAADIQTQEIIRDQKNQDMSISNNAAPVDASLLVAQGPTIVSRQWESEALTRTAALPSSWVAHGSIVAPAVWLGQGAYTAPAAPTTNTVPNVAMNSIESSPISLPPGGYQLARDSITGHLLLIPTANIELMDRPSVWPAFNSTAGNIPIQQLVTQQQHTQFEQVLPQPEPLKTADSGDNSCNITSCDISNNTTVKAEEKMEDLSGQVPSVPLATGQTYAFTTFPTQCDPAGFSYVLQSSTVMHLAHTQTTASIQTESGRRSQATSPLHCATPSPPPNTCSVQVSVTEDESENESDMECCENNQQQITGHTQSVTTAIQVDMDSQTNSEEDEDEEGKVTVVKSDTLKVEMSDSANQTDSVPSESPKSELEAEDMEIVSDKLVVKENTAPESPPKLESDSVPTISVKDDSAPTEPGLEILTLETELAPSLPVESKPVMDFIDHHGLNLLVDSIEEFASREQETQQTEDEERVDEPNLVKEEQPDTNGKSKSESVVPKSPPAPKIAQTDPPKSFSSNFKTLDTNVTDGLGLLCALAEQRFFEEALNDDSKTEESKKECPKSENKKSVDTVCVKEHSNQSSSNASSAFSSICSSPTQREVSEMEMRLQIEELQKKYKQKQRELELLRKSKGKEINDEESCSSCFHQQTSVTVPVSSSQLSSETAPASTYPDSQDLKTSSAESSSNDSNSFCNDSESNQKFVEETDSNNSNNLKQSVSSIHISTKLSHSNTKAPSSSGVCTEVLNGTIKADKDHLLEKKSSPEPTFEKNDKSKTPFFDEQAWFVRRSERIFLSDARTTTTTTTTTTPVSSSSQDKGVKKANTSSKASSSSSDTNKEKKEHTVKLKNLKSLEETPVKKSRNKPLKPKTILSKKRLSVSSDSDSSSDEKSESECSDAASCTSENLPLSTLVEGSSSSKTSLLERQKRLSTDSEYSSGQSDDLPLSVLLEQKIPELPSCILKPEALQENVRLLILDEGLFYAGYVTKSESPDMYGIIIDGDRAARPHNFSKEEILNAAVLEVQPIHRSQLPEGSRICAFWSQQYRCLYPGTVTKASSSSPLTDPDKLYVEFDDGDRGRIELKDIRMLPSDFPIVSLEPNPFMILGKRRSRTQSQNNYNPNSECKSETPSNASKNECDKSEHKKQKTLEKISKKNSADHKTGKEKLKSKSPSATSRSRSSSKSSTSGHSEAKLQNSATKKDEEKKKSAKHSEKKSKDANDTDAKSVSKPKKHKKHKEDHHKHHHHHHKHHHHKKHKAEGAPHTSTDTAVIPSDKNQSVSKDSLSSSNTKTPDTFILENSKSDLTMKIKKSPSPHTNHDELFNSKTANGKSKPTVSSNSSSSDEDEEPPAKKQKKSKLVSPSKRKERVPSVEKSKIAAFLPDRQLWRWSGKSFRRPAKGKAKKEFYRSIQRGKEEIKVGDCAVFLSTGRPHLPYIGRIETMWESWGGKMAVRVKWFYHPEETKSGKKLSHLKGALFQSDHFDENDVQTISHKCEVLSWAEYQQRTTSESTEDNNDMYFLAGTYEPTLEKLCLEPGVPNISSSNTSEP